MALKVSTLNSTHPDYDGPLLEEWLALYEGEKRWHELIDRWLPQHPQEPESMWSARKMRATYLRARIGKTT